MTGRTIKLARRITPAQWGAYAEAGWELLCQVPHEGGASLHLAVTLTIPLDLLGEPIPTWLRIVASGDSPVIPGLNDKTPARSVEPSAAQVGQGAAPPPRAGAADDAPARDAAPDPSLSPLAGGDA